MRKLSCLALAMLVAFGAASAHADSGLTELEYLYRYISILGTFGVQAASVDAPKTEIGRFEDRRITSFDQCKIVAHPDDNTVYLAAVYFPEGNADETRVLSMLLALNREYKYDGNADALEKMEAQAALKVALDGGDAEYCGYQLIRESENGLVYIGASREEG